MTSLPATDNLEARLNEWRLRQDADTDGWTVIPVNLLPEDPSAGRCVFPERDPDAWHAERTAKAVDFLIHRAAPAQRSLKTLGYHIAATLYAYDQDYEESVALLRDWNHGVFQEWELKDFAEYPLLEIDEQAALLTEIEAEMTPEDHAALRSYECGETLTAAQWAAYDQARDRENTMWRHAMKNRTAPATLDESVAAWNQIMAENQPAATNKKSSLYLEHFDEIEPRVDCLGLVEGLLDRGAMSVLYGESNTGKTFVALDLAFHIATGRPWHGRRVAQGLAVYVAAEGGYGIRNRIAALRAHYEVAGATLALIPCPIDLSGHGVDVQPLLTLIATAGRPAFIVIDTLSRALGGGNENASEDMGAFIRNVDRLRDSTGAHVLIVHHSGKDTAKGARGHSSLRAATDTELEIPTPDHKNPGHRLVTRKQRDMEAARPFGFTLQSIDVQPGLTSCVVIPHSLGAESDFRPGSIKPNSVTGRALTVLENMTMGGQTVASESWHAEFARIHYPENKKVGWQAFQRAKRELSEAGLIFEKEGQISREEQHPQTSSKHLQ